MSIYFFLFLFIIQLIFFQIIQYAIDKITFIQHAGLLSGKMENIYNILRITINWYELLETV